MKRHKKNKKYKSGHKKQAQQPENWLSQTAQHGVQAYHEGDLNLARQYLENVLEHKLDHLDALHYLGLIAQEQGQYARAIFLLDQATKRQPEHPLHHNNLANVYAECGQLDKAIHCYEQALQASPDQPNIIYNLANIQRALSLQEEAIGNYRRVLELQSNHTDARLALTELYADQGALKLAETELLPLLQHPDNTKAQSLRAKLRLLLGDPESAESLLQEHPCDPDNLQQWSIRLLSLFFNQERKSLVSNLQNYPEQSLDVFHDLFILLQQQQSIELAECYVEALREDKHDPAQQTDLLNKLLFCKIYPLAQEFGQALLQIYPESIPLLNNVGIALSRQSRLSEAMGYFHAAQRLSSHDPHAMANAALTLYMMRQHEKAASFYRDLLATEPDNTAAHSTFLLSLHYNPHITKQQIYKEHLCWDQQHALPLMFIEDTPKMQQKTSRPLRIGFTSGSFKQHPVGFFILGLLQNWCPEWANIYLYSDTKNTDMFTQLIRNQSLTWRETAQLSDNELTKLIQTDSIDILFDLSGHAEGSRLLAFARSPAPIQAKWVGGQFNTTGMQAMDHFLTDWVESPEGEEEWFTERLVRLPDGYVSYTPPDYAPEVGLLPALRNRFVTFGCFNNLAKVNQEVVRIWSEILRRTPRCKLVLKSHQLKDPEVVDELSQEFQDHGISPERLDLRQPSPHGELLAQYNDIDIALDPFPYSGGLTTCEALWMGVPVLTKPGETFAGRHAASHVSNVGLTDWVVDTEEEYIETAIKWAKNLGGLTKLRAGLREQMRNSPLCDHERFAQNFRDALYWMWQDKLAEQEAGALDGNTSQSGHEDEQTTEDNPRQDTLQGQLTSNNRNKGSKETLIEPHDSP